jgi:hypothetical protein
MFGITTSREFLAKLEGDFADFMQEPGSGRLALNCAVTAYHLHDWVWREWLKNDKATRQALGIGKHKREFLAWIDRACVWFIWIQELATGAKHFEPTSFKARHVSLLPEARNLPNAGAEDSHWDGPMPFFTDGTELLLIDNGPEAGDVHDRYMPAAMLLEVVVRFWREFFEKYAPPLHPEASTNRAKSE